ncbi:non-ribosomal peptide synthetase [Pseudomonas muyukensis]|uniref:Amino acid adenylation domain-containing protein n=1 Tax=Pseudomonas muyukensis TaxID=2842357 RepID=A0ABX8M6R3_9PSED|nr:amino acid adenylation domain-containing protein [Pseudomonas muyukensis]QXH33939.1 amino acid adenylation domain-containing protein [Pseudomonas muyukensis]
MNAITDPCEVFQVSCQQAAILDAQARMGRPLCAHLGLTLDAAVQPERLEQAARALSARYEILRTEYRAVPGMRRAVQAIAAQPRLALLALAPGAFDQAPERAVEALAEHSLVLSLGSGEQAHRVMLSLPLASVDRVSLALLGRELLALYAGEPLAAFEGLQYADYSDWQAGLGEEAIGQQGERFWRELLQAHPALAQWPGEPRGSSALAPQCARQAAAVELGRLDKLAGEQGLDGAQALLMVLWGDFVGGLGGQQSWLVSQAVTGRNSQLQDAVGHFALDLPVLFQAQPGIGLGERAERYAAQAQLSQSWLDCFDAAQAAEAGAVADFGFEWQAADDLELHLPARSLQRLRLNAQAAADGVHLTLTLGEGFPAGLAEIWLQQFVTFVAGVLADPALPLAHQALVDSAQAARLGAVLDRSGQPAAGSQGQLQQLFEAQVARQPEHTALIIGAQQLSYAALDRRANQVAHALRAQGVGRESVVAVYGERSLEIVVAMLGVLKAGAAYLPLDPSYPSARLGFMLEDAKVAGLIALQALDPAITLDPGLALLRLEDAAVREASEQAPPLQADPADLAYIIYTSGSTGTPKGVMISHANARASTCARLQFYAEPVQRFLMLSSFSFDSSVAGIFWSLAQGGSLVLPQEQQHKDPQALARLIEAQRISHFLALPSLYAQILDGLGQAEALRCVIVAGETCPAELALRHRERLPGAELVNEYGPSEGAVWCSAYITSTVDATAALRVPIGEAIAGTRLYVLDEQGRWAGFAREGELCLAGVNLARGYLGRPGLTASRFIPDPLATTPGQRCYRSGDLASVRVDGLVDYLGRLDHQLKIRGHRIELGEIEALLGQQPGVREAVVIARETQAGKQLVAFVVGQADEGVLARLRDTLPEYMVPTALQVLDQLPRTPNGKVDRLALSERSLASVDYLAPRNDLEAELAAIWQEALGLERVGVRDNFFALGGHSLLATRIRSQVQQRLDLNLPLKVFFEGETIELLAEQIEAHRGGAGGAEQVDALEALFAETQE